MFRLIFLVAVFVLALSFLGISLQSIVNSPAGQQNFAYLWQLLQELWQWIFAGLVSLVSAHISRFGY